jgi:hypothetical protein
MRNFGDGVCCSLLGDHLLFRLSRFIMLRTDRCGMALYAFYVVVVVISYCYYNNQDCTTHK